jgi:hypothetical protein
MKNHNRIKTLEDLKQHMIMNILDGFETLSNPSLEALLSPLNRSLLINFMEAGLIYLGYYHTAATLKTQGVQNAKHELLMILGIEQDLKQRRANPPPRD